MERENQVNLKKTPFETILAKIFIGEVAPPLVVSTHGHVDYITFQLDSHLDHLQRMEKGEIGMDNFKDFKAYYGMNGNLEDCIQQLKSIIRTYHNSRNPRLN
jgi:hypothetical protein